MSGNSAIEIEFDEDIPQQEENPIEYWLPISLSVNGKELYGPEYGFVEDMASSILLDTLDSISAVDAGERFIIQFDSGPSWLTVDPIDEESIELAACTLKRGAENPSERHESARTAKVARDAWKEAVIEFAHDFEEQIHEIDSDLANHKVLVEIREKITKLEQ